MDAMFGSAKRIERAKCLVVVCLLVRNILQLSHLYIYIYISTKWVTKVWNCCGNFSLYFLSLSLQYIEWVTEAWNCCGNFSLSFLSLSLPHLSHGRQYLASCHSPINRDDSTIIHKSKTKKRKMPKRMLVVSTKLVNITFLELHPDEDQASSYYFRVNFQ